MSAVRSVGPARLSPGQPSTARLIREPRGIPSTHSTGTTVIPHESSIISATNRRTDERGRPAVFNRVSHPGFANPWFSGGFSGGFAAVDPADDLLVTDQQSMKPIVGAEVFQSGCDAPVRSETSNREGHAQCAECAPNAYKIAHPPEATRISWAASHAP